MSGSGLPVSHVGEKVAGGVIATGSPTVHVGSTAVGIADRVSACLPSVGQPVNPMLGCKLLPEEIDFALTAPDTFTFARGYLSSNSRVGSLGQGWWLPGESMQLELSEQACVLVDAQARRISFPPLAPGMSFYSGSERLWIRRGGLNDSSTQPWQPWDARWAAIAEPQQRDDSAIFLLDGNDHYQFQRQSDGVWRLHATFGRNGYRTEYAWGERGHLTSIRDSAGRSYVLVYQMVCAPGNNDDGMRLFGVVLASHAGPTPLIDPQAPGLDWLVRYEFNDSGDLIAVRNRQGEVVRVFAWCNHLMIAHGEPGGLEVRYEWDEHTPTGRVIRQTEKDGLVREFHYQKDSTEVVDSLGRMERYHFTGAGGEQRWTALTRADGSRLEFEYDLFGRQVAFRDPLGRETRRRLDGQGRLREEQSPARHRYRQVINEQTDLLDELVDVEGRTWRFERDTRGNVLRVEGPSGVTRYTYGDLRLPDRPTSITTPTGSVRILQWSTLGQLTSHTDCSGHTIRHEYDAEGRLAASQDAMGQVTRWQYDALGQVTTVIFADGTRLHYRYDAQGRQTAISDEAGNTTQFVWDHAGRLVQATDPAGRTQHYQYDAAGRLCALTDENGALARFVYDALDRLVEQIGFDGRVQRYRYNAADECIARIEADGLETRYAYDRDGRLTARELPGTPFAAPSRESYSWFADGRLASVSNPECQVHLAYDKAGNLCLENQIHADGWVYDVAHQHDEQGVRQLSRYGDAPALAWLTYGSGHLHGVRVAHVEMAFERDALHREIHRDARRLDQAGVLFQRTQGYDPLGRLAQQRLAAASGATWQRRYRHDAWGQLTAVDDDQYLPRRYQYEPGGRLVASKQGDAAPYRYVFDPAGNRLDSIDELGGGRARSSHQDSELYRSGYQHTEREQEPGVSSGATRWPGNRVTTYGGNQYRFDAGGNLIERVGADGHRLLLGYDGAQRLVHLTRHETDGSSLEAHYRYDGLGRRIAKRVRQEGRDTLIRYGWDGDRQCAEVDGTQVRTLVHEPGSYIPLLRLQQRCAPQSEELLQVRRALALEGEALPDACRPVLDTPHIAFFHNDQIGTPLRLSDDKGLQQWRAAPDDWQAVRDETGPSEQPVRFQGQYHDKESGLYYNRHRYYLPELGRYASQDPIGLAGGTNPYQYAHANPVVAYDPTGLIVPLVIVAGFLGRAALGAAIEVGMQGGKQILGQMKDNWDNDRSLTDIKLSCIDINWKHVAASAAIGTVAPGMLSTGKTVYQSSRALKTLSGQAANTANRAAKLAARKAAHRSTIKEAVAVQAAWQTGKAVVKCPLKDEQEECPPQ
ncbi:RHS repeat-associated core domain-containing protein [Pseudomonas sp. sia0905]|uniref:RHS repeat-associated core domain-containing protein n=1 Tax=Pseudomonas sp. sia0905 TaxID=2854783 RepID=UPI001C43F7E2|nr:RHS repeat-associated core domain-containing protein [Pseudomonas sp. sia0905]MBV7560935.1 RHS domain-containing protein [Pseudomonas sp. sia0905]